MTSPVCVGTTAWAGGRGAAVSCRCRGGSRRAGGEACVHGGTGRGLDSPGSCARREGSNGAEKWGPGEHAGAGSGGTDTGVMGSVSCCQGPVRQRTSGHSAGWGGVSRAHRQRCSGASPAYPGPFHCDRSALCWPESLLPFLPDDLASKANILIDPLELQAATMDDLDEDEEPAPAAAQVPR